MANFNPMERNSLVNLMAALGSGMSGSSALTEFQNILNQQQSRVAANKDANNSLIDLLAGSASQGGSLQSARALAGAYDPGKTLPPAIKNALDSLYPQSQWNPQQGGYSGGSTAGPANNISPAYQPPPVSPQDALAAQQIQQNQQAIQNAPQVAQALATQWASFVGTPNTATGQPWTAEEVMSDFVQSDAFSKLDVYAQSAAMDALQQMLTTNVPMPGSTNTSDWNRVNGTPVPPASQGGPARVPMAGNITGTNG